MSASDGDNIETNNLGESAFESKTRSESSKKIPPEIVFRRFDRVPVVVVPRYDIRSYLLKSPRKRGRPRKNSVSPSPKIEVAECNKLKKQDRPSLLSKFNQKCTVKLVNEDLVKLQQAYLNKQAFTADSDSESDIMGEFKCKICEKAYSVEKKLLKHQANKHMIVYKPQKPQKKVSFSDKVIIHEVQEYHKCRKCPKIFKLYKHLKKHMKLRHKKRKCYICNYCNKNFIDRTIFKVHIKLHCDVCGEIFPNKAKYYEHRRISCRTLKQYKCKDCDGVYFSFMHLKDHSYEHGSTYYICDVCKDNFASKCGLAHHIAYLHSNKRPTSLYGMRNLGSERLYLCNFCEETSVDKDAIESHVSSLPDLTNKAMTGYKDYYFCDQCLKKFSTEKDMLHHKWSHFLKTSENSQTLDLKAKKVIKTSYKIDEVLPEYLSPKLVLEKIKIGGKVLTDAVEFVDVNSFDINRGDIKKPVVDPKSKKTIISKYQCQNCGKYYSSNYCLNRHVETQHLNYDSLQCKVCEETFVWPSLLQSHKCIRIQREEMPFDDARPEIHFDNLHQITENDFDDIESDDYMNSVDFDIPAPIVELTEYDSGKAPEKFAPLQNLGYKLVMQEVPIEF